MKISKVHLNKVSELATKYEFDNAIYKISCYEPTKHDKESKILILGTRPSPEGYENGFYYMSSRNKLYKWLQGAYKELGKEYHFLDLKKSKKIEKLKEELYKSGIVIFDTVRDCLCIGSSDKTTLCYNLNSIKEFDEIFNKSNINTIIFTSKEARRNFEMIDIKGKYINKIYKEKLSTPSGNSRCDDNKAIKEWSAAIQKALNNND